MTKKDGSPTKVESTRAWADTFPEVKRWLSKIQAKDANSTDLQNFCAWAHKTPTELLALKNNPGSKVAEALLDDFVVDTETGFKDTVKGRMITSVKSFYKHNYADIARSAGSISLQKVKPTNLPIKANLRRLRDYCQNPRDRALITFVSSTAIAKETLSQLKWSHLEEGWEKINLPCINIPAELLKGHGVGRYKGMRQITFLTPEAQKDLIFYRDWLEAKMGCKLTANDHIFLEISRPYKETGNLNQVVKYNPLEYDTLGTMIFRLSKNAGVKFSWHDARRYVNTALEQIAISSNWARKIRGRSVRGEEAPYSQPAIEQLREKFREAVPLLEFTSERDTVLEERVKTLEEAKGQFTPEQIKLLATMDRVGLKFSDLKFRRNENLDQAIKRFIEESNQPETEESEPEEPNPQEAECKDGKHCQEFKQIAEIEILEHLKDGWAISYKLGDGQVIVHKD